MDIYEEEESGYDYHCSGCNRNLGSTGQMTVFWPIKRKRMALCLKCYAKYVKFLDNINVYLPLIEEVDDGK